MIYRYVNVVELVILGSTYHRIMEFIPLWVESVAVLLVHKKGTYHQH